MSQLTNGLMASASDKALLTEPAPSPKQERTTVRKATTTERKCLASFVMLVGCQKQHQLKGVWTASERLFNELATEIGSSLRIE